MEPDQLLSPDLGIFLIDTLNTLSDLAMNDTRLTRQQSHLFALACVSTGLMQVLDEDTVTSILKILLKQWKRN